MMLKGLSDDLLSVTRKQIRTAYNDVKSKGVDSVYFDLFIKNDQDKMVIKEIYENYTAAFGMIVNQSGFQTAIAIYSEDKSQSEGKRSIVLNLMFEVLKVKNLIRIEDFSGLKNRILDGEYSSSENYENLFKEASIALKRSIRTYEIKK